MARGNDMGGVVKSLWSHLQMLGYPPSSAAKASWHLVRSCRPKMKGHAESLAQLAQLEAGELNELLAIVKKTEASKTASEHPARREMAREIACVLDGLLEARRPPPSLSASPAPLAQSGGAPAVGGPKDSNDWVTPHTIASMEATWSAEPEAPDSATLQYRALVRALWRTQPLLLEQTVPGMEARGALWQACKEAVGA